MALLPLRFVPDEILRRQAQKLGKVPASLKKLTDNMIETMHDAKGVGLAANQVGSLQKVAVIQLPEWEEAIVLINPEIVKREGERDVEEGCLSVPGYRGQVKRSVKVRARALGLDGKVVRIKADGLLAQALEHETDHLKGILYTDHLMPRDSLWKIVEAQEAEEEAGDEKTADGASPTGSTPPTAGPLPEAHEPAHQRN